MLIPTIPPALNLFVAVSTDAPPLTKYAFCVNVKVELAKLISVTKLKMKVLPKMVVVAAFGSGLRLTAATQKSPFYSE
jgi:hypothetical protein